MSTNICSYEGCMVRRLPCSSIAFFAIPTDSRRQLWIENSGNKDLEKLDGTRTRLFCEKHFHDSDIRSQFHRKTLRKSAIPVPYKQTSAKESVQVEGDESKENEEQSLEANELQDSNVLIHNDNVVACEFEIISKDDTVEQVEEGEFFLSNYEQQDFDDDDEMMEILVCDNSDGQLVLEDSEANTVANAPIPIEEESPEIEATVTTTTMPDCDEISEELTENTHLSTTASISTVNQEVQTSCNTIDDDDKHFALSLVGYFQRLNHEKKVIAKLKILSYLTALDLGKNIDL